MVLGIGPAFAQPSDSLEIGTISHYGQYFCGVELLHDSRLSTQEKRLRYLELTQITGIDSEKARAFIEKHRSNLDKWLSLRKDVSAVLSQLK
jgi:uncharacterized HAD superfamily protein